MRKWLALLFSALIVLSISAGCTRKAYFPGPKETKPTMKVLVYYPGSETILGEEHEIPKSDNVPLAAIEELVNSKPNDERYKSIIPKETKIIDLKIENGMATVNFSREVLNARVDAQREILGIAAIVRTLTEFEEIQQVKILVEGRESGKLGDKLIEDWWGNGGLKNQPFKM